MPRDSCFASGVGSRGRLLQLGGKADRARVQDGVSAFEVRDTVNMHVGGIEVRITWVRKALVPQEAFSA